MSGRFIVERQYFGQSVVRTGKLVVDLEAHVAEVDDRPLRLTGKEYRILELLSLHKGTTVTKAMFLDHLYGGIDEAEVKIIDVFVCKLRKKLGAVNEGHHYIETVWGRGYTLREPRSGQSRSKHVAALRNGFTPEPLLPCPDI
jgi:two-component system cell cycle response regulator CtrA